jgi:small subunit ribosomal protein S17
MNNSHKHIKQTKTGIVTSDVQDKTVVVKVTRRVQDPSSRKYINLQKKYHAHDENNQFKIGDQVIIELHKPISKLKKWKAREI